MVSSEARKKRRKKTTSKSHREIKRRKEKKRKGEERSDVIAARSGRQPNKQTWLHWGTDLKFHSNRYNIVVPVVTYLVPIISMGITYFKIGKELWFSQSIGEVTSNQLESINSKRKVCTYILMFTRVCVCVLSAVSSSLMLAE